MRYRYFFTANAMRKLGENDLSAEEALAMLSAMESVEPVLVAVRDGFAYGYSNGNYSFVIDETRAGRRTVITVRKESTKGRS